MPPKLYKYRGFSVNSLRAVTEAEIFYPQPSSFNDPLDCDPTIEVDLDRVHLERLFYRLLLARRTDKEARDDVGYLRYLSSEYGDFRAEPDVENYLVRLLASAIKRELDRELAHVGVLSLSATWKSGLMWSHYADEHRGICIEYDTRDQEHPKLLPVNYHAPRAVKTSDLWRWKAKDDAAAREAVFSTYFYAKSSEWRYEREWRDLRDDSGVAGLPFRITAILFGLRCDQSVITSIVKLLNDHPEIKLWQMRPKDESFALRRYQVDRDEIDAIGVREPGFLMFKDLVQEARDLEELDELEAPPQAAA